MVKAIFASNEWLKSVDPFNFPMAEALLLGNALDDFFSDSADASNVYDDAARGEEITVDDLNEVFGHSEL